MEVLFCIFLRVLEMGQKKTCSKNQQAKLELDGQLVSCVTKCNIGNIPRGASWLFIGKGHPRITNGQLVLSVGCTHSAKV
jgi:hypothetical protein